MIVFVVLVGEDYRDLTGIGGVFSTLEKAEKYVKEAKKNKEWDEYCYFDIYEEEVE